MTPVNHDLRCTDQSTSNSAFHYSLKGFKLPDIKLPKFDGNPLEWNNWFELFQTAIGNNTKLTDVEKITYLQSLCVDKAKNVVECYDKNSSQYIQAKEELIRRCGNPKFVVAAFTRELKKNLSDEPQTFVRFAAFLRKLVHNFELNNYTSELKSSNLTRLARSKLPPAVLFKKEKYCLHNQMDYATLKDLTDWLNNYSRACKNFDVLPEAPRTFMGNKDWKNNQQQKSFVTMRNSQHTEKKSNFKNEPSKLKWLCPLDNGDHYIGHCPAFVKLTTQQKTQLVKDKRLYFNCLGNHRSTDCTSARRCITDNCGGKHQSTLHKNQDKNAQRHSQKSNNINLENQMNAKAGFENQLQFMPITLFNNNKAVPCYANLDNCSSSSYVLKSTADSLQCKPSRKDELSIHGAFSEDTVSSNLVQLHIGPFNSTSATLAL